MPAVETTVPSSNGDIHTQLATKALIPTRSQNTDHSGWSYQKKIYILGSPVVTDTPRFNSLAKSTALLKPKVIFPELLNQPVKKILHAGDTESFSNCG